MYSRSNRISTGLTHFALILGITITLFPFIWMFLSSFKSNIEVVMVPPTILPAAWVLEGYERVIARNIVTPYINTIITSSSIVVFQLLMGSMAAYAFARLEFPFKNVLFGLILCMIMVPNNMTLIPKYKLVSEMGFADSLIGIILPNAISITVTFFLRQSFMGFPKDLEEAAVIDGCSRVRIFRQILMPLHKGIMVAMGIMVLLFAWNDLLWPTVIVTSEKYRVLSMFIALCKGQYITDYGFLMAASVCAVLPMIVIYAIFQKTFVSSVVLSGIKG
jgi:multiple sugar transport system permease protein